MGGKYLFPSVRLREYEILLKQFNNLKQRTFLVHRGFILDTWKNSTIFYNAMLKNKKMYEEIERHIADVKQFIKELKQ